MAYDQDTGINARLRYSIILGNEGGFFEMNAQTGELFLVREIDLEKLTNPTLSLQIQASQVDNQLRQALARVDISVQDINDNWPEVSSPGLFSSKLCSSSQLFLRHSQLPSTCCPLLRFVLVAISASQIINH